MDAMIGSYIYRRQEFLWTFFCNKQQLSFFTKDINMGGGVNIANNI